MGTQSTWGFIILSAVYKRARSRSLLLFVEKF